MIIQCPKCKVRLKVPDEKIKDEGTRFRCLKCSTVLLVKKPKPAEIKPLDPKKVLVAHDNPEIITRIEDVLTEADYAVITSNDGVDAMVKISKERPLFAFLDVALPKIYGFEVCKRLKNSEYTRGMRIILIASIYDKTRYRREPASLYGADDYIEDHMIEELLLQKMGITPVQPEEKVEEKREEKFKVEEKRVEEKLEAPETAADELVERAKRLARTIVSDITLYNQRKVTEGVNNDTFFELLADEIKEGQKLYENRISPEIRAIKDFYREAIENFIKNKKRALGLL
ncbi:MAG: zinc-ribbon domain-containing protein [Nitrospirae bacterium]|nr:zinc-ribbon domain-containing protein [Nitrospirota bacterium]